MICFRDKTFCSSENCTCGGAFTEEDRIASEKWWGGPDAPVAFADYCNINK